MSTAAPVPTVPASILATAREVARELANETCRPQTIEAWADDWNVADNEQELADYREAEGCGAPLLTEVVEPEPEDDPTDDPDEIFMGHPMHVWDRVDDILDDPFYEDRY